MTRPEYIREHNDNVPRSVSAEEPVCPICGNVCEEAYLNQWQEVIGCECCITTRPAWLVAECTSVEG